MRDDLTRTNTRIRRELRATRAEAEGLGRAGKVAGAGAVEAQRGVTGLSRSLPTANAGVTGLADRLGRGLVTAAKAGAIALGVATTAVIGFGLKSAANLETSRVQLEAITGSAGAAQDAFAFLKTLDPNAPFDIGQLLAGTTTLANFGFEAQALQKTIQGVVDVASTSTDPQALERIAIAVGQIHQSGALMSQDLNQLIAAGAPVGEAMQKAFGMTVAEFKRAQESGSVGADPDAFLEALFGLRAGVAEQVATNTLTGLLSSVRSRVMFELSDATSPLVESLKASLPAIEELIGTALREVLPPLVELGGTLIDLLVKALPLAVPILKALADGVQTLVGAALPGFGMLEPVIGEIVDGIGTLVTALVPVMPDLVRAFVGLVLVLPDLLELLADLITMTAPIVGLVADLLEFDSVRGVLAGLLAGMLAFRAIGGVIGALNGFAGGLFNIAGGGRAAAGTGIFGGGGMSGAGGATAGAAGLGRGVAGMAGLGIAGLAVGQFGDRLSGARGGTVGEDLSMVGTSAAAGALIGTSIAPGIGTLIGGGIGAGIGGGVALGGHVADWLGLGKSGPSGPSAQDRSDAGLEALFADRPDLRMQAAAGAFGPRLATITGGAGAEAVGARGGGGTTVVDAGTVVYGGVNVNNPTDDVDVVRALERHQRDGVERARTGGP